MFIGAIVSKLILKWERPEDDNHDGWKTTDVKMNTRVMAVEGNYNCAPL
jgi:hypothetical protein